MKRFQVLSINPQSKTLERVPYETRDDAESGQRWAQSTGRLMVEIVGNFPKAREGWRVRATALTQRL